MTIGFSVNQLFGKHTEPPNLSRSLALEVSSLESRIGQYEESLLGLERRLDTLTAADQSAEVGVQVAALRSELKATLARIQTLEDGLLESPEKALSVPLLRNDLRNLRQAYKDDLDNFARSTDRIYDQNKWFIGLMSTMAVGLIGLAVSNFVQARARPKE